MYMCGMCCSAPGITNTSGCWMTPAFQLHLSRVDQVAPQGPAAALLAGIRFPAALADKKQQQAAAVDDLLRDLVETASVGVVAAGAVKSS